MASGEGIIRVGGREGSKLGGGGGGRRRRGCHAGAGAKPSAGWKWVGRADKRRLYRIMGIGLALTHGGMTTAQQGNRGCRVWGCYASGVYSCTSYEVNAKGLSERHCSRPANNTFL